MKTRRPYAEWLPPPEKQAPAWADRAAATLNLRLRVWAALMVLGIMAGVALLFTGQVVAMVAGLVIAAGGSLFAFFAERRVRAARRTGWRTAAVTLSRNRGRDSYVSAAVRFADGSRIDAWSRPNSFAVPAAAYPYEAAAAWHRPSLPVLVAGYGPAMTVVLLPDPPRRRKPVVFGARAETYRWRPDP